MDKYRQIPIQTTTKSKPTIEPPMMPTNTNQSIVGSEDVVEVIVVVANVVVVIVVDPMYGGECVTLPTVTLTPVELDNALFKRDAN